MKKVTAIYPGTFDPITNGHVGLIKRGLKIFDRIIVAIAKGSGKKTLFDANERVSLAKGALKQYGSVDVESFDGLLVDYARSRGVSVIIRGLRAVSDFEYELQLALMNRKLDYDIETVFIMPSLRYIFLSSTIVKEAASFGGSVEGLVPDNVEKALLKKFAKGKKR